MDSAIRDLHPLESDQNAMCVRTALCTLCKCLNIPTIGSPKYRSHHGSKHHPSFAELETSAAGGCELCILFLWTVLQQWAEESGLTRDEMVQHHQLLDETRAPGFMVNVTISILTQDDLERTEAWNGLTYARLEDDLLPTRVPSGFHPWLSLSPVRGDTANIVGRHISGTWEPTLCLEWIEECSHNHHLCPRIRDTALPTRVIEVEGGSSKGTVRILESAGKVGQYVTLSYCWGSSKPLSTLRANYAAHLNGLELQSLPKLYRDAITATRALGFRYLWIDALCIVQDSLEDWQLECARMGSVYENAALSINAPGVAHTELSFLRAREKPPFDSCELLVYWEETQTSGVVKVSLGHSPRLFELGGEFDSPLEKRAWVTQEYVLSPRILSFGSVQV